MTQPASRRDPSGPGEPLRSKVFISYSHKDKRFLERLLVHLKPLELSGLTEVWSDRRIASGQKWREEIRQAIATARVAILLVSIDFLTSDFITRNELPPLLRDAKKDRVLIVPVIIQPCQTRFTRTTSLAEFQAENDPAHPLSALKAHQREAFWDQLAARIQDFLATG
jgi:hypothetical protein